MSFSCMIIAGQSFNVDLHAGWLKAIIYLPTLEIWDTTEGIWRNLLAYEDSLQSEDFCCFLLFMDALIDSADDVSTYHLKDSDCLFFVLFYINIKFMSERLSAVCMSLGISCLV